MANSVLSALHFHNEEAAFAHVEALLWPNGAVCPHCGSTEEHIGRLKGKSSRIGLRKCYGCRKTFTVRIGTIFEDSHLPLHLWLQVIHLMCASKKGIATRQIQRMLNCSMKTAWFLTHRIREAMKDTDPSPIGGEDKTVESDESWVGGKESNKHKNKKSTADNPIRKASVVSLVERGGKVRSFHVPEVTAANLRAILHSQVHKKTKIMTDEASVYTDKVTGEFADHETVNHSKDEYVRGEAHVNSAENYFSILKRGITGCYFHVSQTHLHRYLAEFDFRYSNREKLGVDDVSRSNLVVKNGKGKRLTYEISCEEKPA